MPEKPFPKWVVPLLKLSFVTATFALLGPLKCSGKKRVPRSGGLLILSSHRADVDPIVLQACCPRHIYFMAKSELFAMAIIGPLMRAFRAFPVNRGEPDRTSLKRAIDLLKEGHVVCVFPEGELSESGEMLPIKPGIALIARQSGVPVICVGIRGTQWMMPYGSRIPRPAFRKVWLRWGEPWQPEPRISTEDFVTRVAQELEALSAPNPL
jgi:1-acyl-sn-glycerol-3-phosphate acyltransferase